MSITYVRNRFRLAQESCTGWMVDQLDGTKGIRFNTSQLFYRVTNTFIYVLHLVRFLDTVHIQYRHNAKCPRPVNKLLGTQCPTSPILMVETQLVDRKLLIDRIMNVLKCGKESGRLL